MNRLFVLLFGIIGFCLPAKAQQTSMNKAWAQVDNIFNHMTEQEKDRVREWYFSMCEPIHYSEKAHNYVQAAIMGRQLLNNMCHTFGTAICDTIVHGLKKDSKLYYNDTHIRTMVNYALQILFFHNDLMNAQMSNAMGERSALKLFDRLTKTIVDAHRYPTRYAYFAAKDSTLARLAYASDLFKNNEAIDHARMLLDEKQHTIGKEHPGYALTLSDLAFLIWDESGELRVRDSEVDTVLFSRFTQACKLQREAMQIYKSLGLKECHTMATKMLSHFYSKWRGECTYKFFRDLSDSKRNLFKQLIREELDIIQPILGNSADEVIACKASMECFDSFYSRLEKEHYESYGDEIFATAVHLFRLGEYAKALSKLQHLQKEEEDKYRYLKIRKQYVAQWMAACYLHMGDTVEARKLDPFYALPPIDRSRTLELDYLYTFEPDNPKFITIAHDSLGASSLEYARMLLQVSEPLLQKENYELTTNYLLQAKTICHDLLGDESPIYAQLLERLGKLYTSINFYQEAALTLEESIALQKRHYDTQSPAYLSTLSQLVEVSNKLNDNKRIIQWSKEKLETDNTLNAVARYELMESIADVMMPKNGNNPSDTASIRQAIDYLHQAIALRTAELENTYPKGFDEEDVKLFSYIVDREHIAKVKTSLMNCYYLMGDTTEALRLEKESIGWLFDYKERHPGNRMEFKDQIEMMNYNRVLNSLIMFSLYMALTHQKGHNYKRELEVIELAEKLKEESKQRVGFFYNSNSPIYDLIENTILIIKGAALRNLKRYEESTQVFQKAMRLREEMEGGKTKSYYIPIRFLASNLNELGRYEEAAALLSELWQYQSNATLQELVVMNGPQREQYWNQKKGTFETTIPRLTLQTGLPKTFGMLYDNALLTKGLLLNTEKEIDHVINSSGTKEQVDLYKQLRRDQQVLMDELQKPKSLRSLDADSLRLSIRTQEYALLGSLQQDKSHDIIGSLRTSWTDIQRHLRNNDVAVEFIAVPMGKDSTDFYALTLRQGYDHPHLTRLFNTKELHTVDKSEYYTTSRLFDMVWQPLHNELSGTGNIYFSPIGVLHQIGIEYLPGMEQYNTYRLSSTRELTRSDAHQGHYDAVLYGGLQFELSADERASLSSSKATKDPVAFRDAPDLRRLRELRGAEPDMPVLEGSLREVQNIDSLMHQKQIKVTTAIGTDGTEESFKALSGQHKSILHISTHGFYQPEEQTEEEDNDLGISLGNNKQAQTQEDRSLSRSGLLMTGAADYLFGRIADIGADDGILTAREISRLDLSGLDLVVLSACETGLGDISGEGVFGLQRGFKKAGAQTLLVSLWKVDDDATQLLMTEFYRNLLSGKTKRQAFLDAQRTLRQAESGRFNRYECWASFVMIDGIN